MKVLRPTWLGWLVLVTFVASMTLIVKSLADILRWLFRVIFGR